MQVLEKILAEIDKLDDLYYKDYVDKKHVKEIIQSHMDDGKDANVPSNDGWIPVEERLPETPKENLAFDNKPVELYLVDIGHEYPIRAFWNGKNFVDGWSVLKAIAWRPLPEPYKPKKLKTEEKPVQ